MVQDLIKNPLVAGEHSPMLVRSIAELELGPSARNNAGARLAAERIVHACS